MSPAAADPACVTLPDEHAPAAEEASPGARTFTVSLVAPFHEVCRFQARSICVPGVTGHLGAMAGHLPLLVGLTTGLVHIIDAEGHAQWFGITGGFFEMVDDQAIVLADAIIRPLDLLHDARGMRLAAPTRPLYRIKPDASDHDKLQLARDLLSRKLVDLGI